MDDAAAIAIPLILQKLGRGAVFLREKGPAAFMKESLYRAADVVAENGLGVATGGSCTTAELDTDDPDAHEYSTIWYAAIYRLLRSLPIDARDTTFLDFGSGKGRALVVAATFPFKRVIGVEQNASLAAASRENIGRMRGRKAGAVDVLTMNAAQFEVPREANLIYFFNPFGGRVLEQVVANIRESFAANRRRIRIVYIFDDHFEPIVRGQGWLAPMRRVQFHPHFDCGIYETTP
jgi:hypothetical protein